MELVYLLFGITLGVAITWLIRKYKFEADSFIQLQKIKVAQNVAEQSNLRLEQELIEKKTEIKDLQERLFKLQAELSTKTESYKNLEEKLATQKGEIEELQKRFKIEFENLAQKIFEEKSTKFTKQNKENLDILLKPLQEKIGDFRKKVEDTYTNEAKQRASLQGELKKLFELNQQITKEAHNLTKALKGDVKTQGNWGEIILESILEKSGLVKDREFVIQDSYKNDEGKRQRPDVILKLPENKQMVIDSKVSLSAYERFFSAEEDMEKTIALKGHVDSIRNHIKELSAKNYQNIYDLNSLDFVLMFMPIEPAFGLAVQQQPTLFQEAFEKNIVLVSPSTLLATLKIIANMWRQEYQNKNAQEIARQGGALYDKFVSFIEDMEKIGERISGTQKIYDEAMNKLSTGKGNLVNRTQVIKKLGAKTTKKLAEKFIEPSPGF
ncbi:DNA recombination protein RmuC [Candidatus Margulisiibacteriota bacterium]